MGDELKVPSQRDEARKNDEERTTPGAGEARVATTGGDPTTNRDDRDNDGRDKDDWDKDGRDKDGRPGDVLDGDGRFKDGRDGSRAGDEEFARDGRLDDDGVTGRSPRVDDEYAAAVPGATTGGATPGTVSPTSGAPGSAAPTGGSVPGAPTGGSVPGAPTGGSVPGAPTGGAIPGVAPAAAVPAPGDTTDDEEAPYRDPYARTGGGMEAGPDPAHATPQAGETPAHAAPDDIVLFDQDPTQVQARWRDLQSSFVDDPGQAVRRADGLVSEVVESLTTTLTSRTGALRDRWKDAEASDTEQLRLALRDYRSVLERLLALSSKSPTQPAQYQSQEMR
ncbi:hypothetical protein [Nonomuraea candida]|uniref:hypothetical protein n=1 Tax=Nonomuraea candida TaxID=359159 RepID=UPI000693E9B0|nr:hypothetical protein [Nonomuraea candida]